MFFVVEIVAALVYYTTWDKISKRAHLLVGWIYFVAAYLCLVVINGIITFMLTPGRWLETGAFWDGFFNPTYWPSLVLRTGICAADGHGLHGLPRDACDRGRAAPPAALPRLVAGRRRAAVLRRLPLVGGQRCRTRCTACSAAPRRRWRRSPTPAHFALWSLTAALSLAVVILLVLPRLARPATAVVLALAAFAFFGGYERLREGVRKPFLIHSHMFSNGLRVDEIADINEHGMLRMAGWAAARGN